jgi:hypothetical protein
MHQTPRVKQTRKPAWTEPINLRVKPCQLQDLQDYCIMIRIVDKPDGRTPGLGSTQNTLARGVLPLSEAATLLSRSRSDETVKITVQLEYNGLPAGKLTVDMRLKVPPSLAKSSQRPSQGPGMITRGFSLMRNSSFAKVSRKFKLKQ